jgi:Holliday junction resolvase-like predicted endonuclease
VASARGVAGARAEDLAAAFLVARGLAIVERNFHCRRGEIDIIARDGEMLVFVEVRLRSRRDFGGAARASRPSSARGSPRRRRSTSDVLRARRPAGSTRCCSMRSIPGASSGCVTSWAPEGPPAFLARPAAQRPDPGWPRENCYNRSIAPPTMDHVTRIRAHFADSAELKLASADALAPALARAADLLATCLLSDGKILACGNGGSAADAQHFAAEMIGRFERERPGAPGHFAVHRHVDPHRRGERLYVRAGVREAGARPWRQGRCAARALDVG